MLASAYLYGQKDETAQAAVKNKLDDKGKKENKIRFFGTPRQIYNYFAEHEEEDGSQTMTYSNFFRCLTPYQNNRYMTQKMMDKYYN